MVHFLPEDKMIMLQKELVDIRLGDLSSCAGAVARLIVDGLVGI